VAGGQRTGDTAPEATDGGGGGAGQGWPVGPTVIVAGAPEDPDAGGATEESEAVWIVSGAPTPPPAMPPDTVAPREATRAATTG